MWSAPFDTVPWGDSEIYRSALLHTFAGDFNYAKRTGLVDPTPPAHASAAWLPVGSVFTDPVTGTTVRTLSWTNTHLTVEVNVGTLPLAATFTSPAAPYSLVSGTASVAVDLFPPSTQFDRVEFRICKTNTAGDCENSPTTFGVDSTSPYEVPLATLGVFQSGLYLLYAEAFDTLGNSILSEMDIFINNPDTIPPNITGTWPETNSVHGPNFDAGLSSADNVGIYRAFIKVDGNTYAYTFLNSELSTTIYGMPEGAHTLTFEVEDFQYNTDTRDIPIFVDTTAPSVPSALGAQCVSSHQAVLAWQEATDNTAVTAYQVNRWGPGDEEPTVTSVAGISMTDTNLQPETAYWYGVQAVDSVGNVSSDSEYLLVTTPADYGAPECVDTSAPSAPSSLVVVRFTQDLVDLAWSPSTDNVGVSGYRIIRNGYPIAQIGNYSTYQDRTARPPASCGTYNSHAYSVVALDTAGNASAPSNSVTVTIGSTPCSPAPPSGGGPKRPVMK